MLPDEDRHLPVKIYHGGRARLAEGGLASAAEEVRGASRNGDEFVVHVNKREFHDMVSRWGEPHINPETGLPEFWNLKDLWHDVKDYAVPLGAAAAGAFLPGIGQAVGTYLPGVAGLLGSTGTQALATGLLGAGAGYLANGGRGALLGGLAGAAGAYGGDLYRNGMDGSSIGQMLTAAGAAGEAGGAAGSAAGGGMGKGALSPALLMAALNMAGSAFGGDDAASSAAQGTYEDAQNQNGQPLPTWENKRKRKTYAYDDVPDYTQQGERTYFENNGYAEGGTVEEGQGERPYYGDISDGRSDDVEALLSRDEYVIDSEVVALLGNGSTEAGAQRLDQMREAVRKHKGSALAAGEISPDALHPLQYLEMNG